MNNAKYLEYLEWGREDWYERHGLDYETLKNQDIITVLVRIIANYRCEAFQNDRLRVASELQRVGNTSFTMSQSITNQHNQLVLDAEVVLVTLSPIQHSKIRVPSIIRQLEISS